jgi:hypothetical protein
VRRADDAHVGPQRRPSAHALEAALLQKTQQFPLDIEGQVAQLVEEERAPSASSTLPGTRRSAPVNAPRSWPKSSLSTSCAGSVVQSTVTNGFAWRAELTWIARAKRPFPVPVSPRSSTVASVCAARLTRSYTARSGALRPTMRLNGPCSTRPGPPASAARSVVSDRARASCVVSAIR